MLIPLLKLTKSLFALAVQTKRQMSAKSSKYKRTKQMMMMLRTTRKAAVMTGKMTKRKERLSATNRIVDYFKS